MNHIENEKNIEKFLDDFHNSFTSGSFINFRVSLL